MNYLITGATGLIGQRLILKILEDEPKANIKILTRDKSKTNFDNRVEVYEWNPYNSYIDLEALKKIDTVVHLAGESVAQIRWSKKTKRKILDSRVIVTKFLKEKIKELNLDVFFIAASAIGIYGNQGNKELDEGSEYGSSYLAKVCTEWEKEIFRSSPEKSYAIRIGIVLAKEGGALKQMTPIFKFNLGSPLGSGKQFMSWIHIDDLISIIMFTLKERPKEKIINGVSPYPITNKEFSKTLARTLNKILIFNVPEFMIKTILGEMASIVLYSQRVTPKVLNKSTFSFKFKDLNNALKDIYK